MKLRADRKSSRFAFWLATRIGKIDDMKGDPKIPGVAFWMTVMLVVGLTYALGFGPACWAVDRGWIAARPVADLYRPLLDIHWRSCERGVSPSPTARFVGWYGALRTTTPKSRLLTITRLEDAAGLINNKMGSWPEDWRHDIPHPSADDVPWLSMLP